MRLMEQVGPFYKDLEGDQKILFDAMIDRWLRETKLGKTLIRVMGVAAAREGLIELVDARLAQVNLYQDGEKQTIEIQFHPDATFAVPVGSA